MNITVFHFKFGFRNLEDALEFYEKENCNHIVLASYFGDGIDEMIFYCNLPQLWTGNPEQGMDVYERVLGYESFVNGSIEAPLEEFTYFPGFMVLKKMMK